MNSRIPRRIIQTGKSCDLPLLSKAAVANVRLLNPDFEYLFFDDTQVETFIDTQFPEYRHVFDSFRVRIQRYDFFRYLAVYHFGGFYFDLDLLLASRVDELTVDACVFPFERLTWTGYLRDAHGMDWEVGNYAFGAAAGHPFLAAVIENCVRAQTDAPWTRQLTDTLPWALRDELYVIYSTGPGLVSRTLAEYHNAAHPVKVLFPIDVSDRKTWNRFGEYGVHLMEGGWRKPRNAISRRLIDIIGRHNEEQAIAHAQKAGRTRRLAVEAE